MLIVSTALHESITTERVASPDPRFSVTHRQEIIGGFDQSRLSGASAVLIGAGGIGSEVAEGLCRKGVGRLQIFDYDVVDHTNLNRQHFFRHNIGKPKATCLIHNLAPHCHGGTTLDGYALSFQDARVVGVDLSASFVVCGVDNGETRVAVAEHYRARATPVVFIAVDLLAEAGHVFVQEDSPASACFGCAFPGTLYGAKAPCFVPASKDALKVTAGLALYACDTLLMPRKRNWNYRRIHLGGFVPDLTLTIEKHPGCPLGQNHQTTGSL